MQEKRMNNPGKNEKFVGSRSGRPTEAKMTKNASMKHANPEFFKRQSDRKNHQLRTVSNEAIQQRGTEILNRLGR